MKTGEIGRDEIFELYIQDREQKSNESKKQNNIYKNILYKNNNNNKNGVENQMGVRCVAITPIVLTSFSNKGLCNITYTQSKIKGLCLIFNRMLNY